MRSFSWAIPSMPANEGSAGRTPGDNSFKPSVSSVIALDRRRLAARPVEPHKRLRRPQLSIASERRLLSVVQAHLNREDASGTKSMDLSGSEQTTIDPGAQGRRKVEMRLAARLAHEKALLQSELDREEQQAEAAKKAACETFMLKETQEAQQRFLDRQKTLNENFMQTETTPALFWLPARLTEEQSRRLESRRHPKSPLPSNEASSYETGQ